MVAMSRVKVGETYWSVTRQKMGNTNVRRDVVYSIYVEEIGDGWVRARWNGNSPQKFYERSVKAWKVKRPEEKPDPFSRALASMTSRTATAEPGE